MWFDENTEVVVQRMGANQQQLGTPRIPTPNFPKESREPDKWQVTEN